MSATQLPTDLIARAQLKWPNVPASYGWLGLDARGRWRIQGELISHPGIREFLARQYAADSAGQWYVQNGPQRAYVDLELAPWVLMLDGHGRLVTHTGRAVTHADTVVVTDSQQILLVTDVGLGAILDHDLSAFLDGFSTGEGNLADGGATARLLCEASDAIGNALQWGPWSIAIQRLPYAALEAHFGFVRQPRDTSVGSWPAGPGT